MIVDVRTTKGERLGRVEVDPTTRPVKLRPDQADRDLFLDWDGAVDDAGHLRSCVFCDHGRLYRSRTLPQVTPFVILLAFAGATLGLLGYADRPLILTLLIVVLVVDAEVEGLALNYSLVKGQTPHWSPSGQRTAPNRSHASG